jgi:hypothetical protein
LIKSGLVVRENADPPLGRDVFAGREKSLKEDRKKEKGILGRK